uniref:Ovomucoid n=1 Tax=Coturnix japonica TaxID=93934 RepID=A0A8C2TJQ5_COTJA
CNLFPLLHHGGMTENKMTTCSMAMHGKCNGCSGNLACPRIFQPVCGTDNVTYPNECSLCRQILRQRLLNMFLLHYLQIDCSNFKRTDLYCTEEYVPHCGSDGVTYGNKCYFCIAVLKSHGSLSLQHLGEC